MSRSGYTDDFDDYIDDSLAVYRWRGQVASAIRGKRGQAFLREMAEALDAMPEKRLITNELQASPPAFIPPSILSSAAVSVCAIGSVGLRRGIDMAILDPEDYDSIADTFGIAHQLVQEIEFENDEAAGHCTPEQRWSRMRDWIRRQLKA